MFDFRFLGTDITVPSRALRLRATVVIGNRSFTGQHYILFGTTIIQRYDTNMSASVQNLEEAATIASEYISSKYIQIFCFGIYLPWDTDLCVL
jgi:hypothetical protein